MVMMLLSSGRLVVAALLLAFVTVILPRLLYQEVFHDDPSAFDPRAYLKPAREAMKQVCVARMTAFGQAGNGAKLRSALGATA